MKSSGVMVKTALAVAVSVLSFGLASAATVNVGSATVQVGGGATSPGTIPVSYVADGETVGYQCDIVTPAGVTASAADGNCAVLGSGNVRVSIGTPDNTVLPSGTHCQVTYDVGAGAVEGEVFPLNLTGCLYSDADGNPSSAVAEENAGSITVVSEGPPTLTFDTTPVALPAGPYGSTQTGTIPANFTPSTGDYSVDFSCVAPAGFTVAPTSGSYDNTDTAADDLTVSATLTGAAQAGTVTCTVTPSDGSTPTTFDIDVSAPAGAETAPVLDPDPASGGTVTVGGGAPGSNGTGTLTVTPEGGVGTDVAEVFCEADAPVSISPASLTFPVGSSAQGFTVTVPLTDAAQTFPGAITCWGEDGNGGFEWSFDVSAPAGVAAPTFIPATSLWSKFALIGVFAALGLLMVGLRRNH